MSSATTNTPEPKKSADEKRAEILFDYAVANPQGFTRDDIERDLGWDNTRLSHTARVLRGIMADDTINLVCDPQGLRGAWLYNLVGTPVASSGWVRNRVNDTETRIDTMKHVMQSISNATDGRSKDGRKARKMAAAFAYLQGELADIEADFAG